MKKINIHILPVNEVIEANEGSNLLDILHKQNYKIPSSCGRKGICGKCIVEVKENNDKRLVYACQFNITKEITVYLPDKYIQTEGETFQYQKPYFINTTIQLKPNIYASKLLLDKPGFNDTRSYISRIFQKIGEKDIPLSLLKILPEKIRENNFSGILISSEKKIFDWLSDNEYKGCYGIAIDLGTTSIAIEITDVISGETKGAISDLNPQVMYGDDVISRISYAIHSKENLKQLQKKVIDGINNLLHKLTNQTGIDTNCIYDITIAGNTTMIHLLTGINPVSLGECPFVPVIDSTINTHAKELEINTHPEAEVYIYPAVGGFVGGDIVSGLVALNLFNYNKPFLFIDLGTNGEIVVGNDGHLWTASTAVGPAFEGGRIQCGMRATIGAIEHVSYDNDDIQIYTIGNVKPVGICGSGLIDLLAVLLNLGIVDYSGKMLNNEKLRNIIPDKIKARIKLKNNETVFIVNDYKDIDNAIFLSAHDVRQLQLSCSAIKCGIKLLSEIARINLENIKKVFVAGTFGYYVNPNNLVRLGLLPNEVNVNNISFVGNTSLAGSKLALINKDIRKKADELAKTIKHIDLSTLPNFEEEFALSTFFPTNQG